MHEDTKLGHFGKALRSQEKTLSLWLSDCQVVQFLHTRGPIAIALSYQVLKSGTSAGANYEEADSGSSDRDTLAKRKIVLRELKETLFRLRVLRETGFLLPAQDPVIEETSELTSIVAALIRNTDVN